MRASSRRRPAAAHTAHSLELPEGCANRFPQTVHVLQPASSRHASSERCAAAKRSTVTPCSSSPREDGRGEAALRPSDGTDPDRVGAAWRAPSSSSLVRPLATEKRSRRSSASGTARRKASTILGARKLNSDDHALLAVSTVRTPFTSRAGRLRRAISGPTARSQALAIAAARASADISARARPPTFQSPSSAPSRRGPVIRCPPGRSVPDARRRSRTCASRWRAALRVLPSPSRRPARSPGCCS